jgi:L-fuconolactonase
MIRQNRSLALLFLVIGFARIGIAEDSRSRPKVEHFIDTHIHLYDTTREGGVPWPPKDDAVLYKPHLPAEFSKESKAAGVTGAIIVEASDRLVDNKWVLDLVADDPHYVALVGNIDPYRADFATHLAELKKDKRFVGTRARVQGKKIDYTDKQVLENFRLLAENDLSLDILTNGGGVEGVTEVDKLAGTLPNLRIVVNHVLGYDIDGKPPGPEWVAAVESLAKNKNVYVKVSGLYQRCVQQPAPTESPELYKPVLDMLWKFFGEKRLVYGSNWPCTKNSGDYESYVNVVSQYFAEKGQEATERYFWKNAVEAYRLKLRN